MLHYSNGISDFVARLYVSDTPDSDPREEADEQTEEEKAEADD